MYNDYITMINYYANNEELIKKYDLDFIRMKDGTAWVYYDIPDLTGNSRDLTKKEEDEIISAVGPGLTFKHRSYSRFVSNRKTVST